MTRSRSSSTPAARTTRLNSSSQLQVNISPANLKLVWAGVIGGLIILAMLMAFNAYLGVVRIEPLNEVAPYLLWGGLGTLILPMAYLPRYRRELQTFKQEWQLQQPAGETNMNALAQLQGRLIIGYALADTPAMIGIIYYLLSSDLGGGLLLTVTSIIVLLRYKPG